MTGENTGGKLFLIPTPLLANATNQIPPATLEILLRLNYFVVEELKTARRLLRAAGYAGDFSEKNFVLMNEHEKESAIRTALNWLKEKKAVALMSEAGAPAVADPGTELVLAAHQNNFRVIPLSGPSSILQSVMASGLGGQNFSFVGYLPAKNPARQNEIIRLEKFSAEKKSAQFFIETPYRNNQLLLEILSVCKNETLLSIGCDLSASTEFVRSKTVAAWKKQTPDLNKRPAVFGLLAI